MSNENGLDYSSSGVDIDAETNAVAALISTLGASTRKKGMKGAPVILDRGFGGLLEFDDKWLAMATDGVGSKLQIANTLGRYQGVGIDCVAMNVNDLLCVGAEPIGFVDYIAVPSPDEIVHQSIGSSLSEACARANVTLAGGETATLPGIVNELDLSGTALGWLPAGEAVTGERASPGDVLIGIPSSGIHSNGYSLVRGVLSKTNADLLGSAPFDSTHPYRVIENDMGDLGSVLLNPTRIYVDPIIDLLFGVDAPCSRNDVHGIAHITGGGLSNLLRLNDSVGFEIDNPLIPQPEFEWIQKEGGVTSWEMHRVFNMGMGIVLIVSADAAEDVEKWVSRRVSGSQRIGCVIEGEGVHHSPLDLMYAEY